MRRLYIVLLSIVAIAIAGCGCDKKKTKTTTTTSVNVNQYMMDASAFDMAAVVAKLKEGKLSNAKELEKFINTESGINNIDLDKDGEIDSIIVKEEKGKDGRVVMAAVAHPKKGEPTTVAEFSFTKNTNSEEVVVEGAYPNYVRGHNEHYYRSTLTGSVVGDMMFYSWLFSPRPMYAPSYSHGMYSPRPVMSGSQLKQTRSTRTTTTKVSPVKKPSSYKPRTSSAKKTASKIGNKTRTKTGTSLKSKAGSTKKYNKRNTSKTKSKGTGFGSKPTRSRSSFGSRSRSFGGSSRSFGSRRRSSVEYKHDINYLSSERQQMLAEQLHSMPMATWRYNDNPETEHLGFIIEDVEENICINPGRKDFDLGDYTSLAVVAVQVQQQQLDSLSQEVQRLREYIAETQ